MYCIEEKTYNIIATFSAPQWFGTQGIEPPSRDEHGSRLKPILAGSGSMIFAPAILPGGKSVKMNEMNIYVILYTIV